MACPNLEDRAWDMLGISLDELSDHYDNAGQHDELISDFRAGETRRYKNTKYFYMIIETNRLPGIRIANIWDGEEDEV